MDPIPYIEHSFLSIDRKIFVKYRTLPLFYFSIIGIPHIQGSFPKTPHPYYYGGLFAFWIDSSRGFIATFILKETE